MSRVFAFVVTSGSGPTTNRSTSGPTSGPTSGFARGPASVPLVVGPDPLVTTNATHISIATHSMWGTFLCIACLAGLTLTLNPPASQNCTSDQRYHDREDASFMVTAGATANTTEENDRDSLDARLFPSVMLAVAPAVTTRVAASTPPPKHLDIFQGAPLRLPKPLSDQFPVRVCSCPLCIITVCDHGRSIFFRKPPASQTCVPRLAWPSQKQRNKALTLAHARDCHDQYCMVYGIQTGGRGGRHILRNGRAIVLQ